MVKRFVEEDAIQLHIEENEQKYPTNVVCSIETTKKLQSAYVRKSFGIIPKEGRNVLQWYHMPSTVWV